MESHFGESVARKKNALCSKFRRTKELPHLDNDKTSYYFLHAAHNYTSIKHLQLYEVSLASNYEKISFLLIAQRLVSLVGKYTEDIIRNLRLLERLDSNSSLTACMLLCRC